ncbi:MAG TPA: hypothetical protein VN577_04925 [Terriglobales bacterium]|nr:hypothetical protein [Terriglobales bacterium]
MSAFVDWALNVRNMRSNSVSKLSMLYAAVRHYPALKGIDFKWFSVLLRELPPDEKDGRKERRAARLVPYDVLAGVPKQIRQLRDRGCSDARQLSWLCHDELLIALLVTLAWRQRNIRECRIGDPETSNIFYASLPPLVHLAKATWVEEALAQNPHQPFWQFHFREAETKTGHEVRGILPLNLVHILEEYLRDHRPNLIGSIDPGTLFLNRRGGALDLAKTTNLVAQRFYQFTGHRVTPHLVRDILAYAWLDQHSEDYLTVSKVLWHQDINTTLRIYGRDFDESNGVCRIDEWLLSRPL